VGPDGHFYYFYPRMFSTFTELSGPVLFGWEFDARPNQVNKGERKEKSTVELDHNGNIS
jgi:hypothetical protein